MGSGGEVMRRITFSLLTAALLLCPVARAETHVNAGISIGGNDGREGFYLAIGDYYHVPKREVTVVRERSIPDDELPVVFFLARQARVEPGVVVQLRLGGMSWMDITTHFRLGPEIYYYRPARNVTGGSPYGRAFGYYRQHPRRHWRQIRLSDEDIVNLVNLRFVAEHEHMPVTQVIRMRERGRSFTTIYSDSHGDDGHGRGRDQGPGRSQGEGQGQRHGRDHDDGH
jgi:hypothetical protein